MNPIVFSFSDLKNSFLHIHAQVTYWAVEKILNFVSEIVRLSAAM